MDAKKLKQISSELKKASAMHKGQAAKIDRMLKSIQPKKKKKQMGKLLVKLGLWMQGVWCKFCCKWNWMISKLIVDVKDCPVAECVCKK